MFYCSMCIYIYRDTNEYVYVYLSNRFLRNMSCSRSGFQFTDLLAHHVLSNRNEKIRIANKLPTWLVVWNMAFIFPFSWEFHHPN